MGKSDTPVQCLYVHVPFCAHKCEYCAFYSEVANASAVDRYVAALVRELEMVAADLQPRTVFFGGGTPSLLSVRHWDLILQAMARLNLLGATEWTIECNPATVSADKARLWREAGVNRVSLGIQSFSDVLLQRLGRIHSRAEALASFDLLRRAGFDNLNLDLMFGIPGQTLADWQATLQEALALESEHLSSYEVTYEEDTPLFAQLQAGEFSVDEDLLAAMFEELIATAETRGFGQYEISNFARHLPARQTVGLPGLPSQACQHNVNYWRGGPYHGLGPSAHSFVGDLRYKNWANIPRYCSLLEQGQRPVESEDPLPLLARAGEIAGIGLRLSTGWRFDEFQAVTGCDLRQEWAEPMQRLVQQGWAIRDADHFQLTRQGLRFADAAAAEFIEVERPPF